MRQENVVMSPAELKTKNDRTDEDQQQFIRPTDRPTIGSSQKFCFIFQAFATYLVISALLIYSFKLYYMKSIMRFITQNDMEVNDDASLSS
jgi:hypothetical protein